MRIKRDLALLIFAGLAAPICTDAQTLPVEGERLRIVRVDGTVVTGTLLALSDGAVVLRPVLGRESPTIAMAEISTMERSLGDHTRFWRHFGITLGVTVVAFVTAVAISWEPCTSFCSDFDDSRAASALFYGGVIGSFIGIPLGVAFGLGIRNERWQLLSVPTPRGGRETWRPAAQSSLALSVSIPLDVR